MGEDDVYLARLREIELRIRLGESVCRVCGRSVDPHGWWTDSRYNAFPDRQSDSDFPYVLHEGCSVQPRTSKDRAWLGELAERYARAPPKPGQLVRIVRLPDDVLDPELGAHQEEAMRASELCLGHTFRIADVAEDGMYGLDVSERVGGWFGAYDEHLWVTEAEVEAIAADP